MQNTVLAKYEKVRLIALHTGKKEKRKESENGKDKNFDLSRWLLHFLTEEMLLSLITVFIQSKHTLLGLKQVTKCSAC